MCNAVTILQVDAEVMIGIIISVFLLTVIAVGCITISKRKKRERSVQVRIIVGTKC